MSTMRDVINAFLRDLETSLGSQFTLEVNARKNGNVYIHDTEGNLRGKMKAEIYDALVGAEAEPWSSKKGW
jgi:hypothetical protein